MRFLLNLAAIGSFLLTLMSAYPGVLNDFAFIAILFFPIWIPSVVISGWIVLLMNARAAEKAGEPVLVTDDEIGGAKPPVFKRRWIIVSIAILILSFVLIKNGIPRKAAFVLSRSAFQPHAATAPASEYQGEVLGRRLGVYFVDRYATDPRGGVYFRTHAGADGIAPDTMSYGFALQPNAVGTPFGRAGYGLSHMVGDWYVFSASNDY